MINLVKTLTSEILIINKLNDSKKFLKIKPPFGPDSPLKIRLLSNELLEGMV